MRMNLTVVAIGIVLVLGIAMAGLGQESTSPEIKATELPEAVLEAVETTFDECDALTSEIIGANGNMEIEFETTISMTFVNEGAGFKNSVGYFTYDTTGAILEQHTVFDNFSGTGPGLAGGGELNPGDSIEIGTFAPGQNIGFFLLADGFRNDNARMWSTVEQLNSDGKDHDAVMTIEEVGMLIGFEDLYNLGDRDYNDAILLITAIIEAVADNPGLPVEEVVEISLAEEISQRLGISETEARDIISEHGSFASQRAFDAATTADSFWSALLGYDVLNGAVAGGGGVAGDSLLIDFQLRNPVTGMLVTEEHISLTIVEQPSNIVDVVVVTFNEEFESYSFDLQSLNLAPGNYDLYLGFSNGTTKLISLVIPEVV